MFSHIIVFIQRAKQHFPPKSYQYDQVGVVMHWSRDDHVIYHISVGSEAERPNVDDISNGVDPMSTGVCLCAYVH